MHEMSLCESIVQTLEREAEKQNFLRVKAVRMEIGVLSGVEVEALRFSFDVVTRGTLAEHAKLVIDETQGAAWCMPCARQVNIKRRFDPCPDCGSHQLQVNGGEEMRIMELEVD